jgi:hypothetical protein
MIQARQDDHGNRRPKTARISWNRRQRSNGFRKTRPSALFDLSQEPRPILAGHGHVGHDDVDYGSQRQRFASGGRGAHEGARVPERTAASTGAERSRSVRLSTWAALHHAPMTEIVSGVEIFSSDAAESADAIAGSRLSLRGGDIPV